jgi:hypothetical protein
MLNAKHALLVEPKHFPNSSASISSEQNMTVVKPKIDCPLVALNRHRRLSFDLRRLWAS